jgi:hypothetical protein
MYCGSLLIGTNAFILNQSVSNRSIYINIILKRTNQYLTFFIFLPNSTSTLNIGSAINF